MAAGSVTLQCRGRNDRRCLCDDCLNTKLNLLRQADPELQRSILQHLPHHALPTAPAHHPHAAFSSSSLSLHAGPSNPNPPPTRPPPPPPPRAAAPPFLNENNRERDLRELSLFSIPLFPLPSNPSNSQPTPDAIGIPPLVRQHIPNIQDCINHVVENASATGPRKQAALVESIEEILALCEESLKGTLDYQPAP